jgi:hypothetical protein
MDADPTCCEVNPLPWAALADAYEAREDARRAVELATDDLDGALATARLVTADAEYDRAREHMGAVGNLLLLLALEEMGIPLQKRFVEVFGGLADAAWQRATAAGKRATRVLDEVDVLRDRVCQLELAVASLVPGIGEPGLRVL